MKKINYFIGLTAVCMLLFYGCNSDVDSTSTTQSENLSEAQSEAKAVAFISSDEYISMSNDANAFGSEFSSKYQKLSSSDKDRINNLLDNISNVTDTVCLSGLISEASSIINIDLADKFLIMQNHALNMQKLTKGIDKEVLATVILTETPNTLTKSSKSISLVRLKDANPEASAADSAATAKAKQLSDAISLCETTFYLCLGTAVCTAAEVQGGWAKKGITFCIQGIACVTALAKCSADAHSKYDPK
jgi:hypothetical protein